MTRIAIVKKQDCNPEKCRNLCAKLCPINRKGEDCIKVIQKAEIDEKLCIGCGICINRCPFEAINIVNLPAELTKQPIHTFGKNGFHLYNLPTPIFGKVVGILGKNGIGKSTAIEILAGLLKPNLGRDNEASYEDLIAYFKGTEAQTFFEKIKQGTIKISYKPQMIELIPKNASGTVKELLTKIDEKEILQKVCEELNLNEVLDRDIKNISGGELQRVAIAATVMKKANFYVFDEPTSYLDIKQRIKVSKFIRELADEETAVMVVEHDLIILDYMTDLIHLMYGQPATYGIVSQPKATRTGMNIYLSGYLKEENVRFRDYAIKFETRAEEKEIIRKELTAWEQIEKKLGSFTLTADKGELQSNEVVGVVGENGIGKTSFVKILAEEIKADKGTVKDKIKVSYKPQYLKSDSEEIVMSALAITGKDLESAEIQSKIIEPLELKKLLMKPLNTLSGGELQRASIALCLLQDADLYLLDEPSAYLDVEQRLIVSKIIKEQMRSHTKTAIVVDHDLLFIDYLSTRMLLFEGKPAVHGTVTGPLRLKNGMNSFLESLKITFRRDPESLRPRVNKTNSQKDKEQKSSGDYYYL